MRTIRLTTIGTPSGQRHRALRLQLLLRAMTECEETGLFIKSPISDHERQRLRFARPRIARELAAIGGAA